MSTYRLSACILPLLPQDELPFKTFLKVSFSQFLGDPERLATLFLDGVREMLLLRLSKREAASCPESSLVRLPQQTELLA